MRKVLMALAAGVLALAATSLPASAGTWPMLTIDPTSGPTGTVVTFTPATGCTYSNGADAAASVPGDVVAAISRVAEPEVPEDFVADVVVTADQGLWTLTYTIPDAEPVGEITFYGFCLFHNYSDGGTSAGVPADFSITSTYAPVAFTVTETPESSTTTTTMATTTTTAPAATITASPTTVFAGDPVAIQASGFAPGSTVVVTIESDPVNLGSYVADSSGRIATSIVVPTDFPAGSHTLKLTGVDIAGSVLVLSTGVTVASRIQATPTTAAPTTAAPAPAAPVATGSTLPTTGSSLAQPALLGAVVLVLGGAVALLAARRRRASAR